MNNLFRLYKQLYVSVASVVLLMSVILTSCTSAVAVKSDNENEVNLNETYQTDDGKNDRELQTKDTDGTKTLEDNVAPDEWPRLKKYLSASPADWSPDLPLGALMPSLDFASDQYVILHSYFGMFVYELNTARIIKTLNPAAIGCQDMQGSDACEVAVSKDGSKVFMRTMETRKMFIWDHTAETERSLYPGDFEQDWPDTDERFVTVSAQSAVSGAVGAEGNYSINAVDFGGYYGYLFFDNHYDNIGGLCYVVDDMMYREIFSERTETAVTFFAEPYTYDVSAKKITAVLTNHTLDEENISCNEYIGFERFYRGEWVEIPYLFAFHDMAYSLPVGENHEYSIDTAGLEEPLEPGQYRLKTSVVYGKDIPASVMTVYAEFMVQG